MRNEKLIGACGTGLVIQAIPLLIPSIRHFSHIHIINIIFGLILLSLSIAVVNDKLWGYYTTLILSLIKLILGVLMCAVVEHVSFWNHLSSFVASGVCILSASVLIKQTIKPNQASEPTLKTPGDKVEAQGTQSHP